MKIRTILRVGMVPLIVASLADAQNVNGVRLQLEAGSELTLEGTSTLHGYKCTTTKIDAYIEVDPAYQTKELKAIARPISNVRVVIPVRSLNCGNKKLEENMLKALKADAYPTITYVLTGYDIVNGTASADAFAADTKGRLTITGTEKLVDIRINARRTADGIVKATGEKALLMTDFGVKPPALMLGTLRVANQISIQFSLKAKHQTVASALEELLRERAKAFLNNLL